MTLLSGRNPDCWCTTCRPITLDDQRFVVCPTCGNKRCPRAHNHSLACTNSNEPGQTGSSWEHVRPVREAVVYAPRLTGKQTALHRALLEQAAKAAGIAVVRSRLDDPACQDFLVRGSPRNPSQGLGPWNAHTDDGDCARLEAALGISVNWLNLGVRCSKEFAVSPDIVARVPYSEHGGDKQATRRECVLLVAAAIGRAMP